MHSSRCGELLYSVWSLLPWFLSTVLHKCTHCADDIKSNIFTDRRSVDCPCSSAHSESNSRSKIFAHSVYHNVTSNEWNSKPDCVAD